VQGVKGQEGELWGLANLLRFTADRVVSAEILQRGRGPAASQAGAGGGAGMPHIVEVKEEELVAAAGELGLGQGGGGLLGVLGEVDDVDAGLQKVLEAAEEGAGEEEEQGRGAEEEGGRQGRQGRRGTQQEGARPGPEAAAAESVCDLDQATRTALASAGTVMYMHRHELLLQQGAAAPGGAQPSGGGQRRAVGAVEAAAALPALRSLAGWKCVSDVDMAKVLLLMSVPELRAMLADYAEFEGRGQPSGQ
jgi:hypothetical protein